MKLSVFGASGGVGRHVVELALAAGHQVVVAVRTPKPVSAQARSVTVDLAAADPAALADAITGADAVLSALGRRLVSDAGIATRGTEAIIGAMRAKGVRRLVVVSAAPVGTVPSPARPEPPRFDPGDGFFMRHLISPIIKRAFREEYADLAQMEDVLRASALEWTVIRPPRLTDGRGTGAYRTALGQNVRGMSVSRADVAHLMLRVLAVPETIRQTVGVAT